MTNKLRREQRICLTMMNNNTYDVANKVGKVLDSNEDFFIYFRSVNFKQDGTIEGTYLGKASEKIIDGYCHEVSFEDEKGFTIGGRKVRSARLVAVCNKSKTVVIISND